VFCQGYAIFYSKNKKHQRNSSLYSINFGKACCKNPHGNVFKAVAITQGVVYKANQVEVQQNRAQVVL